MALQQMTVLDADGLPVDIYIIGSGRAAAASSQPVALATEDFAALSAGPKIIPATQFTRPANTTTYAAGDLVANNTTAGSVTAFTIPNAVRAAGEHIRVERVNLRKSSVTLTNANFRIYLFSSFPTLSVGDNGVFNASGVLAVSNLNALLGYFDVTMDRAATAGARGSGVPSIGASITAKPDTGTDLYALVEVLSAYAPGNAETFDLTLEGQQS